MLSSLLMFGSSYKKSKILSIICYIAMLITLFIGQVGQVTWFFLLVNFSIFAIIPIIIRKVKNEYLNAIYSVCAIIIWSMIIDIICYYMFPQFVGGATLFTYIGRGILFNARYIVINTFALLVINAIEMVYKMIKGFNKEIKTNKVVKSTN